MEASIKIWGELEVLKVRYLQFMPVGTDKALVKGQVTFEEWQSFSPPTGTSLSITLRLRDKATNDAFDWMIDPRIIGTSTVRRGGCPSQWDLFCQAVYDAGMWWGINGLTGLVEDGKFRATDGTQVDAGYKVLKLVYQDSLEMRLDSGKIDREVFGEKFKFLKGLNAKTRDYEHVGLNSKFEIWARVNKDLGTSRSMRRGASSNTSSSSADTAEREIL